MIPKNKIPIKWILNRPTLLTMLIFGIIPILISTSWSSEKKLMKLATVELQWEEMLGAGQYELEIQDLKGKKLKTFKSKTGKFRVRMPVGKYQVRARVADSREIFSDWSDVSDFIIPVDTPVIKDTSTTVGVPDTQSLKAKVDLKWEPASQADTYRLQILNEEGVVINEIKTDKTHAVVDLLPGKYQYRVIGVNQATQIESHFPEKNSEIIISQTKLPPPQLQKLEDKKLIAENYLKWTGHPLSNYAGELEYMPHFGTQWVSVKKFPDQKETTLALGKKWTPGKYRMQLWAEAQGYEKSEPTLYEFTIKPTEKDLP